MKLSDYENLLNNLRTSKNSQNNLTVEESTELLRVLYKLASTSFNQHDSQKALKYYAEALAIGEKANLNDTLEIACVNNSLGNAYLRQNELDDALKYLQKASEIFKKHADNPEVKSQIVENTYLQAMAYDKKKQYAQAVELYQQALKDSHALEKNEAAKALVIVYDRLGNLEFDKGPDYWKKGLEVALANFGKESIEAGIFYENLAWVYFHEGKFNEAVEYAENSLTASTKNYGIESFGTIRDLYCLGEMHSRQGDSAKGLEYYDKLLGVLDKDLSDQYDKKGHWYMIVSRSYFSSDNKQKAQEAFEKAVKVAIKGFGEGSLKEGEYYDNWGRLLKDNILTVPESKKALTKALSIFKKDGKDKVRLSRIYSDLGEIAYYDDQFDEALESFKECLKISENNTDVLEEVYSYIGNINLQKGNLEESVENHKKAIEICKKRDYSHPELDFHYRNLGEAYDKKGDFGKAKEAYQSALELAAKKYGNEDETTQRDLELVVNELRKMNKLDEISSLQKKYQSKTA